MVELIALLMAVWLWVLTVHIPFQAIPWRAHRALQCNFVTNRQTHISTVDVPVLILMDNPHCCK